MIEDPVARQIVDSYLAKVALAESRDPEIGEKLEDLRRDLEGVWLKTTSYAALKAALDALGEPGRPDASTLPGPA